MRISDWSSDVCSSDLWMLEQRVGKRARRQQRDEGGEGADMADAAHDLARAQRSDDESPEIGGRNQADDHRAAARAFEPEPDQRRQKTAARHHHKNPDQQAPQTRKTGDKGKTRSER